MSAASGVRGPGTAAPKRPAKVSSGSAVRLTLLLAVALALIGVAGGEAMGLLQRAMRVPSADDTAQLVCTAYQSQNYDILLNVIDPTPVPPAQTGPFDAAARSSLANTLKSLDAGSGEVTSCAYQEPLPQSGSALRYILTMRRTRVTVDITMPITLLRQPDGSWKVSRGSDFTGIPGHPSG